MPADKVRYYNKIDIGIFLFMLETCLTHENYNFDKTLYLDTSDDLIEKTLKSQDKWIFEPSGSWKGLYPEHIASFANKTGKNQYIDIALQFKIVLNIPLNDCTALISK